MRIVVTIQARLSSQRLPGKILRDMRGRPMLDYLVESLRHARGVDGIVIATSDGQDDDATAVYAAQRGLDCHRGPLEHVAQRLFAAGSAARADAIVRISGDSPLLDPVIVDRGVTLFASGGADIVSNVRPRSYPKGQSVEVISLPALGRALAAMSEPDQREHVTPYLYAHPAQFPLRAFGAETPRPDVQLSVDTPEDFARCESILDMLPSPPWQAGWRACVDAYDALTAKSAARA